MAVGGNVGIEAAIDNAAILAAFGLDPMRYLKCRDPLELAMYEKVISKADEHLMRMHERLAQLIRNQIADAFK